jgi:hypothetical protein
MPVSDSILLVFLAVAAVIHIAGITILGFLLRESLRITRAVGALVATSYACRSSTASS